MASSPYLLLMTCLCVTFVDATNTTFSNWQRHDNVNITGFEMMTSAASAVSCVGECRKRSHCDSCAHDGESRRCYLQVQTEATAGPQETSVVVFKALCSRSDAVDYSVMNVTWRGSSLVGDLSCNDDDFMYNGDSPTVSCQHPGVWVKNGTCARRIYRNTTSYEMCRLPRSPEPGWSMCVKGTACAACDRFSFNLKDDGPNIWDGNHYFHMDVRFDSNNVQNKVCVNSANGDDWLVVEYLSTFPFALGQPFEVELRLISQDLLQVFVDNMFLTNFTNFPPGVTFTHFAGPEPFDFVDVWAGCD